MRCTVRSSCGRPKLAEGTVPTHTLLITKDAVHSTLHAEPFKPFSLRLTNGSLVRVPHPEFIVMSKGGRTAVVNTQGEKFSIVDLALVTAIEFNPANGRAHTPGKAKSRRRKRR